MAEPERPNGHAHCRALLLPSTVCLNVVNGLCSGKMAASLSGGAGRRARSRDLGASPRRGGAMKVKMILPAPPRRRVPSGGHQVLIVSAARPCNAGAYLEMTRMWRSRTNRRADRSERHAGSVVFSLHHIRASRVSACRHYRSRGAYVALGGLHVNLAAERGGRTWRHDLHWTGEDTWPKFLADSSAAALTALPVRDPDVAVFQPSVRDLISATVPRPHSIVVSRGCPHGCDFCYKDAFFEADVLYTQTVDAALARSSVCPGSFVLSRRSSFGDRRFATGPSTG